VGGGEGHCFDHSAREQEGLVALDGHELLVELSIELLGEGCEVGGAVEGLPLALAAYVLVTVLVLADQDSTSFVEVETLGECQDDQGLQVVFILNHSQLKARARALGYKLVRLHVGCDADVDAVELVLVVQDQASVRELAKVTLDLVCVLGAGVLDPLEPVHSRVRHQVGL